MDIERQALAALVAGKDAPFDDYAGMMEYIKANSHFLSHTYCPACEEIAARELDLQSEP